MKINLTVNGEPRAADVESDTPLLWVLREELGLTGTKFGCGAALCGACTVQLEGAAVRSCVMPASAVEGKRVTTIEGVSNDRDHPLQRAWILEQVPQCGYCQPGMIMAAKALLEANPNPTASDIDASITNLCRCGTYPRIKRAILRAARGS